MNPDEIWANGICLQGIWSHTAVLLKYNAEANRWEGAEDHHHIDHMGLDTQASPHGCVEHVFSSENKDEVETWTNGVMSALNVIRQFGSVKRNK